MFDVNKTSKSKDCHICHYWYFFNKDFKFETNFCYRCHDLLMMYMDLSDIVLVIAALLAEFAKMRP